MNQRSRPNGVPERAEVVVIGGGIAGVATAYFLAKRGLPVVLCEKGRIAGEQSSRNWGWVRKQGRDPRELPAIIESLRIWEGLEQEIGADLGWHQGGVTYLAESERELAGFESWLEHARQYQLDSRILSAEETDELLGQEDRKWAGALHTASDGRAEPGKAVPALAEAAERLGVTVLTECAVRTLETEAGRVSGVVTEKGPIACKAVVCAAGAWTSIFNRNLGVDLPQLKVRASVQRSKPAPLVTETAFSCGEVALRRRQDGGYSIAQSSVHTYEIVPDSFRYFRPFLSAMRETWRTTKFRVTGAFLEELSWRRGWQADEVTPFERHRVLDPEPDHALLDKVMDAARRHFPQLAGLEVAERWAGMIETTPDAIPVMGAVEGIEGYYLLTGLSGHGFGMGPGAGLLMSELIVDGRARVDLEPFRFSRFSDGSKLELYTML